MHRLASAAAQDLRRHRRTLITWRSAQLVLILVSSVGSIGALVAGLSGHLDRSVAAIVAFGCAGLAGCSRLMEAAPRYTRAAQGRAYLRAFTAHLDPAVIHGATTELQELQQWYGRIQTAIAPAASDVRPELLEPPHVALKRPPFEETTAIPELHHPVLQAVPAADTVMETSRRGVHVLKVSVTVMALTAAAQLVVAMASGSAALLNDTLHNGVDAVAVLPVWVAFSLGRRPPTSSFTYGFGRAEDLAGIVVVGAIGVSVAMAAWQAVDRLVHPRPVAYLGAVVAASVLGFVGNEVVARYRIRVGREIGSAALVADGLHARSDAVGSLGVLVGAIGVALGFERADGLAALVIAALMLVLLRQAMADLLLRLMDAVRPALVIEARSVLEGTPGVEAVGGVRLRWVGHCLHAEAEVTVDAGLGIVEVHEIAEAARRRLTQEFPRLVSALVQAEPSSVGGHDHQAAL